MQVSRVFSLPGMDKILIHGGHPLSGSIKISGSKNSALPILAATLLTKEHCIIRRVPDLSDTNYMVQILTHLGAHVERASGNVNVTAEKIDSVAPYDVVRRMRASVCVLGPLLGRCKEANVSMPGGCVIGDRPIDLHLKGCEALGAAVRVEGGNIKVFAPKLHGAVINLRGKFGPTVLGTDNIMMAAVLADGTTVIEGAAQEPEVVDLANFLNKMGAKIEGAGTRRLILEGEPYRGIQRAGQHHRDVDLLSDFQQRRGAAQRSDLEHGDVGRLRAHYSQRVVGLADALVRRHRNIDAATDLGEFFNCLAGLFDVFQRP